MYTFRLRFSRKILTDFSLGGIQVDLLAMSIQTRRVWSDRVTWVRPADRVKLWTVDLVYLLYSFYIGKGGTSFASAPF